MHLHRKPLASRSMMLIMATSPIESFFMRSLLAASPGPAEIFSRPLGRDDRRGRERAYNFIRCRQTP
jgi:hypothetical protein